MGIFQYDVIISMEIDDIYYPFLDKSFNIHRSVSIEVNFLSILQCEILYSLIQTVWPLDNNVVEQHTLIEYLKYSQFRKDFESYRNVEFIIQNKASHSFHFLLNHFIGGYPNTLHKFSSS